MTKLPLGGSVRCAAENAQRHGDFEEQFERRVRVSWQMVCEHGHTLAISCAGGSLPM